MGKIKTSVTGVVIGILILGSCAFLLITRNCEASGNAIYVDDSYHPFRDGSAEHPYESVQDAIDLAHAGDTIYVFGGTYNETLVIDKNLTLIGSIDDGPTVICKNARHKYAIEITADYVTLESFTISDTSNRNRVALVYISSNNVVMQGNNITQSNTWGLYLDSSDDNTIGGNFINNTKGTYLTSSHNNVFSNNNFSNCKEAGISLASSSGDSIIYNNTFINCKHSIYGQSSSNNNITKNTIASSGLDGIKLAGGSNNIIKNNHINDSGSDGVDISSTESKVIGNHFYNNQIGILLGGSNCEIKNNFVNNSKIQGIYISSANNNIIYLNRFVGNAVNAKEAGNNQWYHETQGNYWDDYNEIDKDLDKIGDTPYQISGGGRDLYPLGYFLKPPSKPEGPSPKDGEDEVGLSITLSVNVSDPDSDMLDVYFYEATEDELYGVDHMVPSGDTASCSFTLAFEHTFLWYAIATDGKLENRSNIWIFTTEQIPPLNEKPVADPGGEYTSLKGKEIVFDGSNSYDPDGNIDFYRWNFGDGSSEILDIQPEHSYSDAGTYTITLTVVDNDGRSNTKTTTAIISNSTNVLPVAAFTAPNSTKINKLINFNAYGSYDTDGSITNYTWNFGDGNVGYGINTAHAYSKAGTYLVMLTITDDSGDEDTTSAIITVDLPSEKTPGFEFILVALAIIFFLFRKKT